MRDSLRRARRREPVAVAKAPRERSELGHSPAGGTHAGDLLALVAVARRAVSWAWVAAAAADSGAGVRTGDERRLRLVVFLGLLCAAAALLPAQSCLCSSGSFARGARAAGLGGVGIVSGSSSPLFLVSPRVSGLVLEVSWANPYSISGLDVGSVGMRYGWNTISLASSVQALQTPTPFRELRLAGSVSVGAGNGMVLSGGAALASLGNGRESVSAESSVALGAAVFISRVLEIACAAETPIDGGEMVDARGSGAAGAALLWGVGLDAVRGLTFVLEEERRGGWTSRRVGGEISWPGVLAVRAGVSDSPFAVSLGVGVFKGRTALDTAVVQHEALGMTPHVSLSYHTSRDRASSMVSSE